MIALLAISTVPPYVELLNRRRPTRVYVLHMALFVGLLVLGWSAVTLEGGASAPAPVVGGRSARWRRSSYDAAPCPRIAG